MACFSASDGAKSFAASDATEYSSVQECRRADTAEPTFNHKEIGSRSFTTSPLINYY